jgi:flagellar biosynthesis/type III secretory pathway protein FliH
MSSSPSPVRLPTNVSANDSTRLEATPFPYGEAQLRPGQRNFPLVEVEQFAVESAAPAAAAPDPQRDAQMREMGRQQGMSEARARFDEQLAAERSMIAKALEGFARERSAYYRKIEEEAVQLAMAIARKVIHREAQVDPLLLMGIVRVALERMEGATAVVLQVHPERAPEWRRYVASHVDPAHAPEIAEDPALPPDRCLLKTSMGSAELGLEIHLKEIERGLMDLLAARPEVKA